MTTVQELRSMRSLLNVRQVANIIGSCIATVRRYAASGKLASIRIGNRLRFDPAVVAAFLESRSSQ
jgi:predicted site-specific integrase-resolvase